MSVNFECPICMDEINITLNSVTTECGHCFHASCLMQNIAHNGFGCPYCRSTMAEVPLSDEDKDEWDDEEEVYDDYTLRGFRLFFNNLNGLEQDEEDIIDENEDNIEIDNEEEREPIVKPSTNFIKKKLVEKGITMEHLINCILFKDHDEYTFYEDEYKLIDDDIYGKIRSIINNYEVSQEPIISEELNQSLLVETTSSNPGVDNLSQPKINYILMSRRTIENI